MTETALKETQKLFKGENFLYGFDYVDIKSTLGDHLSESAEDRLSDLSSEDLKTFFENVHFETLDGEVSEDEVRSFARSLPAKGLTKGLILLFNEYLMGEINDIASFFRDEVGEAIDLCLTGIFLDNGDNKRISVWYN